MIAPSLPWTLRFYFQPSGRCPAWEFLQELRRVNPRGYISFREVHKPVLEEFGPSVGRPLWRGEGDGLAAISWKGPQKGNFRIYATAEAERRIVMLLGTNKKWWRFDQDDKSLCQRYRADYRSLEYDHESRWLSARAYYQRRGAQGPF